MRNFYLGLFLFCLCLKASAQFSGSYAPAKWSTGLTAGSNGSVNASAAPASITITGSNDPGNNMSATPINTDYTITVSTAGIWRFNWAYHTNDSYNDPMYDVAGVLINGSFTQLTNNTAGATDQSETYSLNIAAGTSIGFRVSAIDNIEGNATFTITGFSGPATALPITLTGFVARLQNDRVLLQWTTLDESNVSGFDIERSSNGNQFIKIATVPAQNLKGLQQYQIIDATPLPGTSFYQLRIREMNGQQRFSAVVTIKHSLSDLQIYPNPVRNNLSINLSATKPARERIDLIDATGRILQSNTFNIKTGQNNLRIENLPTAKGIYYLKTQNKILPFTKE